MGAFESDLVTPDVARGQLPDLAEHEPELRLMIARKAGDLIPILQAVQGRFGYLPRNVLEFVAHHTKLPLARVWGVATFYASFSLTPRGRHIIRVCSGTACHVRGATRLMEALASHVGVDSAGGTSDDLEHTLETVACVGCCSLAPVVAIDAEVHGKLDWQQAVELLTRAHASRESE